MKWYFQNVRHELWDYNLPPAPSLIDIKKDGKTIPALAQVGKSGYMFILDRVTGKPVFGVEERPVAQGDVLGEPYPYSIFANRELRMCPTLFELSHRRRSERDVDPISRE